MTIPEILRELEPYTREFQMVAMREAIEQREAITFGAIAGRGGHCSESN